jgi:hypothetical protein
MNYASAFLVLILGFAAIYWYISGRRFYSGPVVEAQAEEDHSDSAAELPSDEKNKVDV